jgi:hypothetical protein
MQHTFTSNDIPSWLYPYSFNSLTIKNFGMKQLALVSKCLVTKDIDYMVQAIGQTIDQPIQDLTIGDFFFLMAWQRVNSYPTSPILAEWTCEGTLYKVPDMEPMSWDALQALANAWDQSSEEKRQHLLDPANLLVEEIECGNECSEPVALSDFPLIKLPTTKPELDPRLDYPRVGILKTLLEALSDPETALLASAVQWIKAGNTIQDKIGILSDEPDLTLFDLAAQANAEYTHGISEIFVKTCPKCYTGHNMLLKIEPSLFFRR